MSLAALSGLEHNGLVRIQRTTGGHVGSFILGGVEVTLAGNSVSVQGETFSNGTQTGQAFAANVRTPDGAILEVAVTQWITGEVDVRTFTRLTGPVTYDRLTKGARLGVSELDGDVSTCELGILSFHADRQPTVIKASDKDLDQVIQGSARHSLMNLGALAVGTRQDVYGDTSKRRSYQAVMFPRGNSTIPVAAYVLTRVLPIYRDFGRVGAVPVSRA